MGPGAGRRPPPSGRPGLPRVEVLRSPGARSPPAPARADGAPDAGPLLRAVLLHHPGISTILGDIAVIHRPAPFSHAAEEDPDHPGQPGDLHRPVQLGQAALLQEGAQGVEQGHRSVVLP